MDADEFSKQVEPALKQSRLSPYLGDLKKLRDAGYTLKQLRDFLRLNNVVISIPGLSAFLQRQAKPQIGKPVPKSKPTTVPAKSLPVVETERPPENPVTTQSDEEEEEDNVRTIFDPSDLRRILNTKVDLDALSKIGKELNRKKKDENRRD